MYLLFYARKIQKTCDTLYQITFDVVFFLHCDGHGILYGIYGDFDILFLLVNPRSTKILVLPNFLLF